MTLNETSIKLSKNPLGIIALFILLIYGFATMLFGFAGETFTSGQKWCFVTFLVAFPVMVLCVFAHLVMHHHKKLYAPGEYQDERIAYGFATSEEQEEKYKKEEKEELENSGNKSVDNDESCKASAERREKREKIENYVFEYYKKEFGCEIKKDVYFMPNQRKVYFDGIAEKNDSMALFKIRYLPTSHIIPIGLTNAILDAINVKDFISRNNNYSNYNFMLQLVLVIDSTDHKEIKKLEERIHRIIDTDVIKISVKVFSVDELEKTA